MQTFELTLKGYDASTDITDDLVKWVKAPDEETLEQWIEKQNLQEIVTEVSQLAHHDAANLTFEDGVDVIISSVSQFETKDNIVNWFAGTHLPKQIVSYKHEDKVRRAAIPLLYVVCEMSLDPSLTRDEAIGKAFEEYTGLPAQCLFKVGEIYQSPEMEFKVLERSTGFELEHVKSGKTHWLSDGVDSLFYFDYKGHEDIALNPGAYGFAELWTNNMNDDPSFTSEVYFPEMAQ